MRTARLDHKAMAIVPPKGGALALSFIIFTLLMVFSHKSEAFSSIEITQGSLVYQQQGDSEQHLALPIDTQVQMTISGWINRVTVKQSFTNSSDTWINGNYIFPLPNEAAVDHMRLFIGDRVIEGQIQEKEIAKKQFEHAKSSGKRASIVEQNRPNIFSTSVANLGPQETLVVEISYQELVRYDQGEFSLRFPMTVNPRYQPKPQSKHHLGRETSSTNDINEFLASQFSAAGETGDGPKVNLAIDLDAGSELSEINSVYHPVDTTPLSNSHYQVTLENNTIANRDFVLKWKPIFGSEPVAAVYAQEGQTHTSASSANMENDYALLMLIPPALGTADSPIARELILVIDTSGSMSGESIAQAKKAMGFALAGLKSGDAFNIIEFNSHVNSLSAESLPATASNIGRANQFIRELDADGGTEIALALDRALTTPQHAPTHSDNETRRLKQVLFMTDGAVTNEKELFTFIEEHIGDARLFTIGIGSAPNSHFMQRAAEVGRGTFTYVGKLEEVQQKIEALLYKIERPQVTGVEVHYLDGTIPDHWPATIPDLYANEPLLLAIKLKPKGYDQAPSEVLVSGMINNQYWHANLSLKERKKAAGLDLVWARKQIAALEMSRDGVNNARIKKQITALALKYHVVSRHTSLIAIDMTPAKHPSVLSNNANVQQATPFGWQAPNGYLPQTGGESRLLIIIGMLLLCLALAYLASFSIEKRERLAI